jgi:hypothetical protein
MNLYFNILKELLKKDVYNKYWSYVNLTHIKENYPEIYKLYLTCDTMQKKENKDYTIDDLELGLYGNYPNASAEIYNPLLGAIRLSDGSTSSILECLEETRKRQLATELARQSLLFASGTGSVEGIRDTFNSFGDPEVVTDDVEFVTTDLQELYEQRRSQTGLRWRLRTLNKSLGSLRKGDFGFLFARPETGKTTFLASEVTFMASQVQTPIIWFNNEEQPEKVQVRCFQADRGVDLTALYGDIDSNSKRYATSTRGHIRIPVESSLSKRFIEKVCASQNPSLIIFDQIDKIHGFEAERYDLKMKSIYAWARELAKQYGPVIAVCQAGGTADGKKWLTMNDIDSSHTAKQGEADWILGIGKTYEEGLEEVRYLHLSKNKLDGDVDTDPNLRHNKWEVRINPMIARYEDF